MHDSFRLARCGLCRVAEPLPAMDPVVPIAVDHARRWGFARTTETMSWALVTGTRDDVGL